MSPLYIHMSESRFFGVYVSAGVCISKIDSFICDPFEEQQKIDELNKTVPQHAIQRSSSSGIIYKISLYLYVYKITFI